MPNISFTDKYTFFLNGHGKKKYLRYWRDENPRVFRDGHTHYPEKVVVVFDILRNTISAPLCNRRVVFRSA